MRGSRGATLSTWHAFLGGLLVLSATPLSAQAPNGQTEPSTPEIVLPPIILELAAPDPAEVQAGLPPVEQLLLPDSAIPLPTIGEIDVALPVPRIGAGGFLDETFDPTEAADPPVRDLYASASLSVGTLWELACEVEVVSAGGEPGFQLQFAHIGQDGVRGVLLVGRGGHYTRDQLSGKLRTSLGAMQLGATGEAEVVQTGLQGQAASGIASFTELASNSADIEVSLDSRQIWPIAVTAALAASTTDATLRGGTPETVSEFQIRPGLIATWQTDTLRLGLDAAYALRSRSGSAIASATNHATRLGASASLQLPQLGIETSVAWRWGAIGHRVPFRLAVEATPSPRVALSVDGGYQVREHGLRATLELPYVRPAVARDGAGWFGGAHLRLGLDSLSVLIGATVLDDDAAPASTPAVIATSGGAELYHLDQSPLFHVAPDLRVSFTTDTIHVGVASAVELWHLAAFEPLAIVEAEFGLRNPSRTLGVDLTARYSLIPDLEAVAPGQLPVVTLDGFWQWAPAARVALRATDLLEPILGRRLLRPAPLGGYLAPGLQVAVSLQLSL